VRVNVPFLPDPNGREAIATEVERLLADATARRLRIEKSCA